MQECEILVPVHGLFLRPHRLRFLTLGFRIGLRLSRVALAGAFFTGSQFQPPEMFPQPVAHQSGPVSFSAFRVLVRDVTHPFFHHKVTVSPITYITQTLCETNPLIGIAKRVSVAN